MVFDPSESYVDRLPVPETELQLGTLVQAEVQIVEIIPSASAGSYCHGPIVLRGYVSICFRLSYSFRPCAVESLDLISQDSHRAGKHLSCI